MSTTIAELHCGAVLMHMRGRPEEWRSLPPPEDVVQLVTDELKSLVENAMRAGIARDKIVLDPGFGFGKRLENNYPLLSGIADLQQLGYPLLVGLSRKGFLGRTAGERVGRELPASERVHASVAAAVIAAMRGAHIVRAHDVRETVEALAIVDAVQELG